jgi:glycolate oxidase FAD binding subunit
MGTLGGAIACGLSGPGRPWSGSVRDAVLGVEMLNGLGERLAFGGKVIKNVAGYDVSRLQVGAFGTLGVLLSASVRVLPVPDFEATVAQAVDPAEALARCRRWARSAYPISATAYLNGMLRIRLSGAEAAVNEAVSALGGERRDDSLFWRQLRDHDLDFFRQEQPLWRCVLPPAAPAPLQDCLVVWGGGLRWWRASLDASAVHKTVSGQQGSAQVFGADFARRRLAGVGSAQAGYQQRIREAFDPHGIFNPELGLHRAD